MKIKLTGLNLEQAAAQFPGCLTPDLLESHAQNEVEEGYHKLGVLDGVLLSSCYEISFISWAAWDGERWQDLEDFNFDMSQRLEEADEITWE